MLLCLHYLLAYLNIEYWQVFAVLVETIHGLPVVTALCTVVWLVQCVASGTSLVGLGAVCASISTGSTTVERDSERGECR